MPLLRRLNADDGAVERWIRPWEAIAFAADGDCKWRLYEVLKARFHHDFPHSTPAETERAMAVIERLCRVGDGPHARPVGKDR